jgi:hypothetical protein
VRAAPVRVACAKENICNKTFLLLGFKSRPDISFPYPDVQIGLYMEKFSAHVLPPETAIAPALVRGVEKEGAPRCLI